MVNARIVLVAATIAIAIGTIFLIFFVGNKDEVDSNGDGVLDMFTMSGELTCDGCQWSDMDSDTVTGESDVVRATISIDTTGDSIRMEIHAIWSIVHFYMVDGTWYTIVDPQTTAPNDEGVEEKIFEAELSDPLDPDSGFETIDYEITGQPTVTIGPDSNPLQVSCSNAGWDQTVMDETFKIRDDSTANYNDGTNALTVETQWGDFDITFENGIPKVITGKYLPAGVEAPAEEGELFGFKDITFVVTDFQANAAFKTVSDSATVTFDDNNCEAALDTPTLTRHLQEEPVELTQEQIIDATAEILAADIAMNEYRAQFGSVHDEGHAEALQMDRNLAITSDAQDLLQVAFSTYREVSGIPAGQCEIENNGERQPYHRASGYTLVARGGYFNNAMPAGHFDAVSSPMHSTICKKGNRCVFSWRGSSNIPNWINNIQGAFTTDNINTDVNGQTRKVHSGFMDEVMFGINARNSYSGFTPLAGQTTAGKSLGEIWNDIEAIAGCTERVYTGHSLGGAAANVGQYLFEKSLGFQHSNHQGGDGLAHTWAAPQAWITDRAERSSAHKSCSNKRFFLSTNKRVDPVPGLLKIAKVTGKDYDFSDTPFEIYHNDNYCKSSKRCTKRSGWRRRWFGTWKCKTVKDCGEQTKIVKKACDDESGGAPLWKSLWKWGFGLHVNPYITYLDKAANDGVSPDSYLDF